MRPETIRNEIILLLIHHLADTGPTPGPDELAGVYRGLIDDLEDLVTNAVMDTQ